VNLASRASCRHREPNLSFCILKQKSSVYLSILSVEVKKKRYFIFNLFFKYKISAWATCGFIVYTKFDVKFTMGGQKKGGGQFPVAVLNFSRPLPDVDVMSLFQAVATGNILISII
jgi:hypothetical protein